MCMRHDPCCLCWSNGATRVSPANVGSCLEPGPPFEMMMIMDSVLSLMESESSLGTNKQAGAGNAKYPHLPMSPISSKDVTMLLSLPSHSSPQAQTHTRGYIHTHTHTRAQTYTVIFSSPQTINHPASLTRLQSLPVSAHSAGTPRETLSGFWGHGIKRTEIDLVSLVLLNPL